MRKYHVRFGGGARVPEGSPALPYLVQTAPCRYPTGIWTPSLLSDTFVHNELMRRCLDLLYLSTQFLWWQAVVGIIGVTSSTALRSNSRCTWRHREGSRNVHNTAIRRALSPVHPCGSVTAGVHGYPRGVAPLRHHTARRDTPVAPHGRRNDPIASNSLVRRCPPASPLFAS